MSVKDPLGMDAFERSELAIAVIAAVLGRNLHQLLHEECKAEPDVAALKELHSKESQYLKEQREIYRGNVEVQKRVIQDYPKLLVDNE